MPTQTDFDVVIVGANLVGASLALSLSQQGSRVALVDKSLPSFTPDQPSEADWDSRIYAINASNRAWLQSLNAWPDERRITPVLGMDVQGDAGGRIQFDASVTGSLHATAANLETGALAWIAESRGLLAAVWRQLVQPSVTFIEATPAALIHGKDSAQLTLSDGRHLQARLVVGADGANSWVKHSLSIKSSIKPYGQSGVVANFACEKPHHNIARQWFLGDSILAYLPLPDNRISIVWSHFSPTPLLALPPQALADKVAAASQYALGALKLITPATAFPLRMIQPHDVIAPRVVLVGDAAHTVHPLAGQGVNLGFADALCLTQLLAKRQDVGEWLVLNQYARERLGRVKMMQHTCDALFELFHQPARPVVMLRNWGLSLTNRLPALKTHLMQRAFES
jgi:ubiquinone biosynthesis UbiH/UbiF/VisC/COQ6 family hydroxylase